ncbi:hypothetical protein CkaCkLH20_06885 [Colletotrichum karsti]|uniref:Uncharacterized protein n=1 Tax=Colletotrichum karsti TaxID=1095194 RepID=A0A9P6LGR4_9PEZI|nr:uncharacterized protein CkaCkLH20_06885 [Colletotrichum karsti]KAF9875504.1 hypothetical protein CkaCkLH20_06885 [Colletotrichum karsti]
MRFPWIPFTSLHVLLIKHVTAFDGKVHDNDGAIFGSVFAADLSRNLEPLPTPPPRLDARDTNPKDLGICGYYTLSMNKEIRTHRCDKMVNCITSGAYLGCGAGAFTTCFNALEHDDCQPGKTAGSKTLCCRETSGYVPLCRTFFRDDSIDGIRQMVLCGGSSSPTLDEVMSLYHSTDPLVQPAIPTVSIPPRTTSTTTRTGSTVSGEVTASLPGTSTPTATSSTATSVPASPSPTPEEISYSNDSSPSSQAGAIAAGVVGELALIGAAVCFCLWLFLPRVRPSSEEEEQERADVPTVQRMPTPRIELPGDLPQEGWGRVDSRAEMACEERSPLSGPRALSESPVMGAVSPGPVSPGSSSATGDSGLGTPIRPAELHSEP